ncbi:fibropellin-1-like [Anneissia japonica]|uniref:fibropellin-1-like n=1 Tax=Anneissia japonica TaxID=1529436 RepID=UPI001425A98A|nr:fibropellin-1-like [Anneissia japonica]
MRLLRYICGLHVIGLLEWSFGQSVCYDGSSNPYTQGQQIQQVCNTCICEEDGWNCTLNACSDPCFSSPCENGGTCVRNQDSYNCFCKSGYFGSNCETDESCSGDDDVSNGYCDEECYCLNGTVTCDPPTGCPDLECNNTVLVPGDCCPICWPDPKAGFCPESTFTSIGSCENTCQHDVNCTGDQKCCFNGCGLSCIDPHPGKY